MVKRSETPALVPFVSVAEHAVRHVEDEHAISLLSYAKGSGYPLDTIGSADDGKAFLANVIVAAERSDASAFRLTNTRMARKLPNTPMQRNEPVCWYTN